MFVYKIELEIDGFFLAEKEINIKQFAPEEFYIFSKDNNQNNNITNIIYEVKCGKDFKALSEQIERDYFFFTKFFEVYPNYDIKNFAIFGFFRSNQTINNFLTLHNETTKKLGDIPIPIILFRYNDTLFGENIYFENPELEEIREVKFLVNSNSEKIDKIDENLSKSIKNLENKFDEKLQNIKEILDDLKKNIKSRNESNIPSIPINPPFLYPPQLFQNNLNGNIHNDGVPYSFPGYFIAPFQLFQGNSNSPQDYEK
jgi:hypothetical protein